MEKNVLIDTNLYLDDANIIYKLSKKFDKILIPLMVLKELDAKKYNKDLSYSARNAIQAILDFTACCSDQVIFDTTEYDGTIPDDKILSSAKKYNATVATKDISMSIRAKSMGMPSTLHDMVLNNIFDPYVHLTANDIYNITEEDTFAYANEYVGEDYQKTIAIFSKLAAQTLTEEQWWFAIINVATENPVIYANNPMLCKIVRIDNNPNYREIKNRDGVTIKARDCYQVCAIFALQDAPHTLITGRWGSGKTLLATAHALARTKKKTFITRAPLGLNSKYDIGFLPGPQPLFAKILTPTGWTTMGKVKKDDYIVGQDGKKTKVIETYDKGVKDVYKIETTNGGVTYACGAHMWATKTYSDLKHNKEFKLRSTLEIKETLKCPTNRSKYNHTLPTNGVVKYECETKLPIPPYTVGTLLCDSNRIPFSSYDEEVINEVDEELGGAETKIPLIPDMYKYSSVEDRLALLQGILDTDGTTKKSSGEQKVITNSKQLAKHIVEIARSLGINAVYRIFSRAEKATEHKNSNNAVCKHISYVVNLFSSTIFEAFHTQTDTDEIKIQSENKYIKIKSVEYVGKEHVKCIKIDNENSLYITDDFIVTHNTLDDKMVNWLQGFMSALYYLYANTRSDEDSNGKTYDYVREEIFHNKFQIMPMNSIQGLSLLDNDTLIVDEAQLITVDYMSMILSRPSETGRLVLLGDIKQAYGVVKPSESGLLKLLRALPHKYMAYVELRNSYRSPLLEIADRLQNKSII